MEVLYRSILAPFGRRPGLKKLATSWFSIKDRVNVRSPSGLQISIIVIIGKFCVAYIAIKMNSASAFFNSMMIKIMRIFYFLFQFAKTQVPSFIVPVDSVLPRPKFVMGLQIAQKTKMRSQCYVQVRIYTFNKYFISRKLIMEAGLDHQCSRAGVKKVDEGACSVYQC